MNASDHPELPLQLLSEGWGFARLEFVIKGVLDIMHSLVTIERRLKKSDTIFIGKKFTESAIIATKCYGNLG